MTQSVKPVSLYDFIILAIASYHYTNLTFVSLYYKSYICASVRAEGHGKQFDPS